MSKSMSIGNQIHRQELAIAGSTLYTKEMPKEAGVAGGSLKRAVVRIRDAMREAGFPAPEIQDLGGATALFMKDPDGLRVEITHYPPGIAVVD